MDVNIVQFRFLSLVVMIKNPVKTVKSFKVNSTVLIRFFEKSKVNFDIYLLGLFYPLEKCP